MQMIVRQLIHDTLTLVAFCFIPSIWLGFFLSGLHTPLTELYRSWLNHAKSGDEWGPFDRLKQQKEN